MAVSFPEDRRFCFGFIDGNHDRDHVRSDFEMVWSRLVGGGVLGLHDYKAGLAVVTQAIDSMLEKHRNEIEDHHEIVNRHVLLLVKRRPPEVAHNSSD